MRYILTEKQLRLLEQDEQGLSKIEIVIFKKLNEVKKKLKKKKELFDFLKNFLKYFSIPEDMARYYLELYAANYRKDGNYDTITKSDLVDPKKMKGKWTPNTQADQFTKALLPFKGSNLDGFWTNDGKGNDIYVVMSYGWYPVYIYRDGIWYEVVERYSSSTGRQMRNADPVEWNVNLQEKVHLLTKDEMKMVMQGMSHEDILKVKLEKLKNLEPELQSKRMSSVRPYRLYGDKEPVIIKFRINSVKIEDGKGIVVVDIYDVVKKEGNKGVPTPENYTKGELRGITKEYIEDEIQKRLKFDLKPYITPRFNYFDELKDIHNVKFVFNHLKEQ